MPEANQRIPHAKRIALSVSFASVLAIAVSVMTGAPHAAGIAGILLALLAVCLLLWRKSPVRHILLAILLLSLIALLRFGLARRNTALYAASVLNEHAGDSCAITGFAANDAAPNDTLYIELRGIDGTPLAHPVEAYARNNTGDRVLEGDALSFRAVMKPPQNGKNAFFDFVRYLSNRGVFIQLGTLLEPSVNESRPARFLPFASLRRFVTEQLGTLLGTLPADAAFSRTFGLTKALLFGDKSTIPEDDLEAFRRCGITHLLCVSGMHFVVIFSLLSLLLSYLTSSGSVRKCVLWIATLMYLALCGFALSAVRAAVMAASGGFRGRHGKGSDGTYRLLMASALILLIFPYAALDTGFHLSFIATFGIRCTAAFVERVTAGIQNDASAGILRSLLSFLLVPVGAFVFAAPYSAAAFGGISTVALPVSYLTVYPAQLLLFTAWLAVLFCLPLRLLPFISYCLAHAMESLANFLCGTADHFASFRFAYLPLTASDHSLVIWCLFALLAAALNIFRGKRPAAFLTLTALVPVGIAAAALLGA